MAGNLANRWDLSASMFLDKGFKDQIRYVAYVPGMAGNLADRWGLSYLEPAKPQSILIKSAQV